MMMVKKVRSLRAKYRTYVSQKWNKLDMISIAVFVVGTALLFVPQPVVHVLGRVVLAFDIVVFSVRFLQILLVFQELGLLLVMAEKMVWTLCFFSAIVSQSDRTRKYRRCDGARQS